MQYHIEKGIPVSRDDVTDECTDKRKTTIVYSYYYQYYYSIELCLLWITLIVGIIPIMASQRKFTKQTYY